MGKTPKPSLFPDGNSPADRIEELRDELLRHEHLYYDLDKPEISDAAYDALINELRHLEEIHPALVTPDSPTQRVGGKAGESFRKIQHSRPMLSLENKFSIEALSGWDKVVRVKAEGLPVRYSAELKMDGLSVAIRYETAKAGGSRLVCGLTRGDGQVGEDITANVRSIRTIPKTISSAQLAAAGFPSNFEVRGEVVMPEAAFEEMNQELAKKGEDPAVNPRNAAAGILRTLDPAVVAKRGLEFYAYFLLVDGDYWPKGQNSTLEVLASFGFQVNPHRQLAANIDELKTFIEGAESIRGSLGYDIDGVVIKVDAYETQRHLGYTGRAPRWAVAYKFPAGSDITMVRSITIQVGGSGKLTPVAELKPVFIGGTTVRRATLHNADFIKSLNLHLGDWVRIERSGDVIPKILEVVEKPAFEFPTRCPACLSPVAREEGEVDWRCVNADCPAKLRESLLRFAKRTVMNIEGLGGTLVRQLVNRGFVRSIADIYSLTKEQLMSLNLVGEKSAQALIEKIDQSKKAGLARVLTGLGISYVGERNAEMLAQEFGSIDELMAADEKRLDAFLISSKKPRADLDTVESPRTHAIIEFFSQPANRALIQRLKDAQVEMTAERKQRTSQLKGLTFVLTGSLPTLSRDEATEKIKSASGKVSSEVSKKTSYVVAGEGAGSKLDRAYELKVRVIDEAELLQLLAGESLPKQE